ncbi:MAG: hypothetical protein CVU63_12065 [Deltaproteobacteria bacterium HGW-Deltaproteobacteria-20]|nr:MAG: hypothetical protein CVU63_12065 [Deltaproteobacteria bacterium HGW-Deltaproteobacteria-20]
MEPGLEVAPGDVPEASAPAPVGSETVEVDAGVSPDPGKARRPGRTSPVGARSAQSSKTPPASTATVDLGY